MNHKFTKGEKLKSRKQIAKLFSKNEAVFVYPVKYIWTDADSPQDAAIQVLISIPKRNFKRAVDRNRLKRLLREAYRRNKEILYSEINQNRKPILLGLLYMGKELLSYMEIEKSMKKALAKIKDELVNKDSQREF